MEKNTLFKKYHRRIAAEGILKSLLYGLIAGSLVALVTALLSWFFGFKGGLWLSIGLFFVGLAATALPLYFFKFRPTAKAIAVRVDALGLEERLLTMLELEGDDSYIATRQREDAIHAMNSLDSMLVKIVISALLIGLVGVSLVFGFGGGTTVSALYYADVIPSGMELLEGEKTYFTFTVNYGVSSGEETGAIVLWTDDLAHTATDLNDPFAGLTPFSGPVSVTEGEDAPAVYAVPATGYAFVGWSDGVTDPYRKDTNVMGSLNVTAMFVPVGLNVEELQQDAYFNQNSQSGQNGGDPSNFDGGSSSDAPSQPSGNGNGDGSDSEDSDSHSSGNQQIIDSNHYYGDEFGNSYNDAQGRLESDSNLSEDMKGWISDYFGSIGTGGSQNGEGEGEGESGDLGGGLGGTTQP